MTNPFKKYLGKEDKLQSNVMRYIAFTYPYAVFSHISNEGKRSPFERYKMKYLGAKPGIPDIMIFNPNKKYNGLAIELKVGYNKPTESQKKWIDDLNKLNWKATWSNDFDQIINLIDSYFKDE